MKDLLIVVPYRDRENHLKLFLENSPAYFNQQSLTYDILICELDKGGDWNAGLCVNSVSKFITPENQYKYIYIHHVDVWPVEGEWIFPDNNQVFFNMGDYGSCLMETNAFFKVNGYSNSFWGWGGEDNEIYSKLRTEKYNCVETFPVKYNTTQQTHPRKFNGANYGNSIKNLFILSENEKNNITHFDEHAYVKDLCQLGENIYKQTVCPLQKSPREFACDKVVVGYLKNETDFSKIVPFVKTAMLLAPYSFDVVIVIADDEPPKHLVSELESFGVKWFHRKSTISNLFIDRYLAFKEVLETTPSYKTILHVDVTDLIFQKDPFRYFNNELLTISSEGISIKDESWNRKGITTIYGEDVLNKIGDREVICGGVIGGPRDLYTELANTLVNEYNIKNQNSYYGIDQILLLKLIYFDEILKNRICITNPRNNDFCLNLHVCCHYPQMFEQVYQNRDNKVIFNTSTSLPYSIIHQYNRSKDLYDTITGHYKQYFTPLYRETQ